MNRPLKMIPPAVRECIEQRSQQANSDQEVGRVIYDVLKQAEINWRNISLDEMKTTLVAALRARHAVSDLSA